jgi:branched-chain amino acid transport system permease protein
MLDRSRRRACRIARWALLVLAVAAPLLGSEPARAQSDGYTVKAFVKAQQRNAQGQADNQPVAGVTITLLDASGAEIDAAVTDDKGAVEFTVPERATYTVKLDEETLPEGQALSSQSAAEQVIDVDKFITRTVVVNFFTGESQSADESGVEKVAQRLSNGVRLGLIIAMCSVGLSLIFGTTGLTNFAHGEMVTFGGMMAFLLNVSGIGFLSFLGFLPLVHDDGRFHVLLATPLAVALGALFGYGLDRVMFAKLRRRGIGLISQMVVTVGLSILLRNVFLARFGGRSKPLREYSLQEGMEIGPFTITPRDLIVTILSAVVLVTVALTLQYTRLGKATRAVADNPDLASATGINSAWVVRLIWISGGALAALGGVFRALDEQVSFDMGGRLLFLMFAGITLGGLGSAFGALVGGFVVGVIVELATLWVPTELKNTPALGILIVVLLLRPQGILGRAQRVG